MNLALKERIEEKIAKGKLVSVCIENNGVHIMNCFIPDFISVDEEIYIQGESFELVIAEKDNYTISYNELEDEFCVTQGSMHCYLG